MKFGNKLLNLQVRYIKERGNYLDFLCRFRRRAHMVRLGKYYFSKEDFIKTLPYSNPMFMFSGIFGNDVYNDEFGLYLYEVCSNELSGFFEKFLKENSVYEEFFNNVNIDFITNHSRLGKTKSFEDCGCDKKIFLYNNVCPMAYFMNAFCWSKSNQYDAFWRGLNSKWEKVLIVFINSLFSDEV